MITELSCMPYMPLSSLVLGTQIKILPLDLGILELENPMGEIPLGKLGIATVTPAFFSLLT